MPEDAPGNPGAVGWPHPDTAYFTVREMQSKLHRWAGEDSSSRFADLFNLVYDPAFLVHAWERVASNTGARTPGADRVTVAAIETWAGGAEFLGQIRDSLKSGEFRPVVVRQVLIPKKSGKFRKLGIPDCRGPRGPGQLEGSAGTYLRGGLPAVLVWVPPEPAGAGCDSGNPPHDLTGFHVGPGGRHPRMLR